MMHDAPPAARADSMASSAENGAECRPGSWRVLLEKIITSLENSKAEDIVVIELDPAAALADAMVIASGRSARHVAAVAERLLDDLRKTGHRPASVEGQDNAEWVLVDFGDIIVHIFQPAMREMYQLEKLWSPHAPRQGDTGA